MRSPFSSIQDLAAANPHHCRKVPVSALLSILLYL